MAVSRKSRKQSVLLINRVYPPSRGASGRMLRDLARGFDAKGWDVTVITTGIYKAREKDGNIDVIRVRAAVKKRVAVAYLFVWVKLLFAALMTPRKDLVVTMTDPPLLEVAGRIIARIKGARHMHWCQDLYPDLMPALGFRMNGLVMKFLKARSRKALKNADKVVTIGRCMAKRLTHGGIQPSKIAVIPNWPDYELIPANDADGLKTRVMRNTKAARPEIVRPFDELRKDSEARKFRVIYSGNLGRAHPIQTLIGAAEILAKEHPEIEFVFVGDGPNFERLAAIRAKKSLDNIRFLPFQPVSKIREVLESGDLHIVSMKHEAAGMLVPCKLYAAIAVARPCILVGPNECEAARIINEFGAGKVIPQGHPETLAAAIREYRQNGAAWFAAYDGAKQASEVFIPGHSIGAWIDRADNIVKAI